MTGPVLGPSQTVGRVSSAVISLRKPLTTKLYPVNFKTYLAPASCIHMERPIITSSAVLKPALPERSPLQCHPFLLVHFKHPQGLCNA